MALYSVFNYFYIINYAVVVDAAPAAVELHGRPLARTALKLACTLILRHDAPAAVGVLVAETLHGAFVDGLLRRGSEGRQQCEYEQYSKLFHCLMIYNSKCKDTKICRHGQKKIQAPDFAPRWGRFGYLPTPL